MGNRSFYILQLRENCKIIGEGLSKFYYKQYSLLYVNSCVLDSGYYVCKAYNSNSFTKEEKEYTFKIKASDVLGIEKVL